MEYFAGANTRNGFKSLFEECFENTDRLYILKGSSGCGKSTLMRRVAGRAQKDGVPYDLIYCSADPNSLDGIILPTLGIAIADGTAPHVMDVKYPCVRESIINLGQFWDESKILPHKDKIISLTDRKSAHYASAYKCLSALGAVGDIKRQVFSHSALRSKLDPIVFRLLEKVTDGVKGKRNSLFSTAFTANGLKTLPVFGDVKTLYRLSGGASFLLMNALEQTASERGLAFTASRFATDAECSDSLYFEDKNTLITLLDTPPCKSFGEEKHISGARFTDTTAITSSRVRLRAMEKLESELTAEAKAELASAKAIHAEIESIYIPAMNFTALDEYTFELTERIFAE